jgi:hypothetical protein
LQAAVARIELIDRRTLPAVFGGTVRVGASHAQHRHDDPRKRQSFTSQSHVQSSFNATVTLIPPRNIGNRRGGGVELDNFVTTKLFLASEFIGKRAYLLQCGVSEELKDALSPRAIG